MWGITIYINTLLYALRTYTYLNKMTYWNVNTPTFSYRRKH